MKASPPAILSDSRSQEERSVQTLCSRLIPHQCSIIIFAQKALIFQNACKLFSELSNEHSGLLSTYPLLLNSGASKLTQIIRFTPWPYRCFIKVKPHDLDSDQRFQIQIDHLQLYDCGRVHTFLNFTFFLNFSFFTCKMLITATTHWATVKHKYENSHNALSKMPSTVNVQ